MLPLSEELKTRQLSKVKEKVMEEMVEMISHYEMALYEFSFLLKYFDDEGKEICFSFCHIAVERASNEQVTM